MDLWLQLQRVALTGINSKRGLGPVKSPCPSIGDVRLGGRREWVGGWGHPHKQGEGRWDSVFLEGKQGKGITLKM